MITDIIPALEEHFGPSAGFVLKDLLKRTNLKPPLKEEDRKRIVDIICDEMLNLSVASTKMLKAKLYSIVNVKYYENEIQDWH